MLQEVKDCHKAEDDVAQNAVMAIEKPQKVLGKKQPRPPKRKENDIRARPCLGSATMRSGVSFSGPWHLCQ